MDKKDAPVEKIKRRAIGKRMLKSLKKTALILFGAISLVLGIVGIVIPVLPTTPFLLLTAFFWLKSSERLHRWLMSRRVLGDYIRNYIEHKAILKSTRIYTVIVLWGGLITSMFFVGGWILRGILLVVGIGVSWHLCALKTITKAEMNRHKEKTIG